MKTRTSTRIPARPALATPLAGLLLSGAGCGGMRVLASTLLTLLSAVLVAACSKSDGSVLSDCSPSSECNAGLTCLVRNGTVSLDGMSCSSQTYWCTTTCIMDSDCAHLGTGFQCWAAGPCTVPGGLSGPNTCVITSEIE